MKLRHTSDYREERKRAYPDVGDQLDALYKLAHDLDNAGIPLSQEVRDWISSISNVKNTFRKPT